ncbi:MAG: hypothetical protein GC129_02080 [Proteobacteria bacterium]|nr:hypothetical protein [Pseudomonadota bacterium]
MFRFLVLVSPLLVACTPIQAPIVQMKGVDPDTYNKDLANCYLAVPAFGLGNPVTKCMAAKGYKVLYGN